MSQAEAKRVAAREAVRLVEPGMRVGLGTGSTSEEMMRCLAERVKQGLSIEGVPTSDAIAEMARSLGIPLAPELPDFARVDLTLDGADEVDPGGNLVKGGGGALLREKLVASASRRLVIMVDDTKHVEALCSTRALPVEVVPYGWTATLERIAALGGESLLRLAGEKPFVTDQGNYIADVRFPPQAKPGELHDRLAAVVGVVETGLFVGLATCVITGHADGTAQSRSFLPAAPRYA